MASHGSDTPTSPRAVLHHTEAILCTFMHTTVCTPYVIDAVGSWQIILPMPNLEGPY